jgi:hypothetical protein
MHLNETTGGLFRSGLQEVEKTDRRETSSSRLALFGFRVDLRLQGHRSSVMRLCDLWLTASLHQNRTEPPDFLFR